jgi:hypothetical protein
MNDEKFEAYLRGFSGPAAPPLPVGFTERHEDILQPWRAWRRAGLTAAAALVASAAVFFVVDSPPPATKSVALVPRPVPVEPAWTVDNALSLPPEIEDLSVRRLNALAARDPELALQVLERAAALLFQAPDEPLPRLF